MLVKIRNVEIIDQIINFELIYESQVDTEITLILTIDDNECINHKLQVESGKSSKKLELYINDLIHGKQLKIHSDDGMSCVLVYSKLWPRINNQYNYSMVKWMNRIQKQTKILLRDFVVMANQFVDEMEEIND